MRRALTAVLLSMLGCAAQEAWVEDGSAESLESVPGDIQSALRALPRAEVLAVHGGGIPAFVRGDLAASAVRSPEALGAVLSSLAPVFRLKASELRAAGERVDEQGGRHLRYQQLRNGLLVVGGEMLVHLDGEGRVYAVNGSAREGGSAPTPALDAAAAVQAVRALPGYDGFSLGAASLVYVVSTADEALHLAWALEASGTRDGTPSRDTVFVDARSGALAEVRPHVHAALQRKVYSAAGRTTLPGTLKMNEGSSPSSDAQVRAAYDNTGTTWNFYKTVFGRDSFDGAGAPLVSTVHYAQGYANAYWDGTQMVYGDGDGQELGPLAQALDITAHELTHAVTESTAGLVYQNEPGALNEAMSDIFAAAAETWSRGGTVDARTWQVGEDVFTPGTAGDALRYMGAPTEDGMSRDYYPQRYTGGQDNGGVHLNSGIANLAFKLLVTGGRHPRNATAVQVSALGMAQAQAIFYRALTVYLVSTSNFAAARVATRQAAQDLYGASAALAVEQAWAAVGVGAVPSNSPSQNTPAPAPAPSPAPSSNGLQNGVPVTGLGGPAGAYASFPVTVPAGARVLSFRLSGGTGDADLYVRYGAKPTTSQWDHRPWLEGNDESVQAQPVAGTWYVMVRGYTAFSGASLRVDWSM